MCTKKNATVVIIKSGEFIMIGYLRRSSVALSISCTRHNEYLSRKTFGILNRYDDTRDDVCQYK